MIMIQKIINSFGCYDVAFDHATDGEEALNYLDFFYKDYDLITLDWSMPKLNGFEVLKKLKELKLNIPVLMITTENQRDQIIRALLEGATGYVTKPFNSETLVKKTNEVLKTVNKAMKYKGADPGSTHIP